MSRPFFLFSNDPISGVSISIHKSNSGGLPAITTNASGEATVDLANYYLTYVFTAALDHSRSAYSQVITSADDGNLIHTFQTVKAKMQATNCNGTPLSGILIKYWINNSGGGVVGTTGASGIVSKELFTGTYTFKAIVNRTIKSVNVDINATGVDYTFKPTQINLTYSGAISIWIPNSGGINVTPGIYMFPGTYNFKFGNVYTAALTVGDCSTPLNGTANILRVLDHSGNPIAGATARGGYGSSYGTWHVAGSTNADGYLLDFRTANTSGYSYEAKVNNTTSVIGPLTTGYYEFQTQQITMRLETCGGTPIENGHIRWGHGASFGSYHFAGGNTNTNGESYLEFFPGTYSFEMGIYPTANVKTSYSFPSNGTTVTWKSTNVTLNYGGSISYGGTNGTSKWFTKPSMELMEGTYNFKFAGMGVQALTFSGCNYTKSAAVVKLKDSQGNGIQGGVAYYYHSGWKLLGTTDANGEIHATLEGGKTKYHFRMKYAGYSQQMNYVNITTTNPVVFQTVAMVVKLENSSGAALNGGVIKYYASGWKSFGTTVNGEATMELLPGKYYFRMKYLGYSQQKSNVQIATTNPLVFATLPMVVKLESSTGAPLSTGEVKYYASGWKTFGVTDASGQATMELLPGKYYFRMKYLGYSQQKSNVQIATTNPLVFATLPMVVKLESSTGAPLSTGEVKYYASGWKTFGITDASGQATLELLPGKYYFRMKFRGYSQQKSNIQIATTNPLTFTTLPMVVALQKCDGTGLVGGAVSYYASGWKTFGVTDANGDATYELLPGKYYFRMKYNGKSNQKSNIQIATTNPLVYTTTHVSLTYGGTIKYYASGWKVFTQPSMDMLPGNYYFRFGSSQTTLNITGCNFSQSIATVQFKNSNGQPIANAGVKYRYGWGAGTAMSNTDSQGKSVYMSANTNSNVKFTITYRGGSKEKSHNISVNPIVDFNTVNVVPELYNSLGTLISTDVNFKYRYAWETKMDIPTDGELLPIKTLFTVYYRGSLIQKAFFLATSTNVDFNTALVTLSLMDNGTPVVSGVVYKYRYAWETKMNFPADGQLLPISTRFTCYYSGTSKEKTVTVVTPATHVSFTWGGSTISRTNNSTSIEDEFTTNISNVYPNPFNDKLNIEFELDKDQNVQIEVYDMKGSLVKVLVNETMTKGTHTINWNTHNGSTVQHGVYVIKLITAESVIQKSIVKVK